MRGTTAWPAACLLLSWTLSGLGGALAGVSLERRRAPPPLVPVTVNLPLLIGEMSRGGARRSGHDTAAHRHHAEQLARRLQEELSRLVNDAPDRVLVLRASAVLVGAEDRTAELRRRVLAEAAVPGRHP